MPWLQVLLIAGAVLPAIPAGVFLGRWFSRRSRAKDREAYSFLLQSDSITLIPDDLNIQIKDQPPSVTLQGAGYSDSAPSDGDAAPEIAKPSIPADTQTEGQKQTATGAGRLSIDKALQDALEQERQEVLLKEREKADRLAHESREKEKQPAEILAHENATRNVNKVPESTLPAAEPKMEEQADLVLRDTYEKTRSESMRLAKEKADLLVHDSQEKMKQAAEKLVLDNALREAQEKARLETVRRAKEKAEQAMREAAQQARLEGERLAKEKLAREAEAIAMRNAEATRIAKEAQEKARLEQERSTREKIELLNQQTQEQEQLIRERAEKVLREAAVNAIRELEHIGNDNSTATGHETVTAEQPDISPKAASEFVANSNIIYPSDVQHEQKFQKIPTADLIQPIRERVSLQETAVKDPTVDVLPVQLEDTDDVQVSGLYTGILAEVAINLKIASVPLKRKPVTFRTAIWEKQKTQPDSLPPGIITDLIEAYTDINLANTIVRVLIDTDMGNREMQADYMKLCQKIALRLAKILR